MKLLHAIAIALAIASFADRAASQSAPPGFDLAALGAGNSLVLLRSDAPQATRTVKITGVTGNVIGIDVRPMDGRLYGITDADALYTIDMRTGAATLVSRLGSPFDRAATSGFDFNPQSDRLRLIAATGQNLRINVDIGAVAIDGPLSYASDDEHAGRRAQIAATAYTNSVARARSTKTFDIDYALDLLVLQEPPNDGTLASVGSLGIDCGAAAGFDIATDGRGVDHAFLVCGATLYRLDLESGAARSIGAIGGAETSFLGLAVVSGGPMPSR